MHVIGTAGHVDHGKSALVTRLTGIDPDRFAEEKRRGLTIDLGFAWLPLPSGREIGLIDVPGHEKFIKNMLAGAGGVSICLFVVAANEGWMPQSSEHLAILDILGVSQGVVALTKSDLVDAETLELAAAEIEERLQPTSLVGIPIVSCSAVTGDGLDALVRAIDDVVARTAAVPDSGRPRLWVDRVFTIAGAGTVVTGTLTGGSLSAGDDVEISPARRRARIRSVQSHKKEVASIPPGNRVALNLAGLDRRGAQRGDAVVAPGQWVPSARLHASVRVLDPAVSGHAHNLTEKGAHLLYIGAAETPVTLRLVGTEAVGPGEVGYAQLLLRDPLPIARGDRFVLRDAGRVLTFGGGIVLDPRPPVMRRSDALARILAALDSASAEDAVRILVDDAGSLSRTEVYLRTGTDVVPDGVVALGGTLTSEERLRALDGAARAAIADHHRDHPLERGPSRAAVRAVLDLDVESFDDLIAMLPDVMESGAVVHLSSHSVTLAEDQQAARAELLAEIDSGGFTPPLGRDLKADPDLLRALVAAGDLVRIGDFFLTAEGAMKARSLIRAHIEEQGPITVAEIRDLLGTSRKYAVPLCEWLDATGATRRHGDQRVLGPDP